MKERDMHWGSYALGLLTIPAIMVVGSIFLSLGFTGRPFEGLRSFFDR